MDDFDDEPIRPTPAPGPPKYLPRIKYEEPPPEDEPEETEGEIPLGDAPVTKKPISKPVASPTNLAAPKTKKTEPAAPKKTGSEIRFTGREPRPATPEPKPQKKSTPKFDTAEPKPHLTEQTPEGETFAGRQRIRMVVTGIASIVLLISLVVVWRAVSPTELSTDTDAPIGPGVEGAEPEPKLSPEVLEKAANRLLIDARSFEKANKPAEALLRVDKVLSGYAETPSAKVAAAAKERYRQGLPLFVDGAAVVAQKAPIPVENEPAEPEPAVNPPAETVVREPVVASPLVPRPMQPVATANPGALPPEPRRPIEVGLPRANVAARALPPGFHARLEAGVHSSGWPLEITGDRDGGTLMLVPGDRFIQGRDDGKPEERPAHRVQLSSYYIDQHETTGRQFAAFRPGGPVDDRAAVNVTLADARAYAQWASKSLPTEAQWEMAARTTDGRLHPWGNAPAAWERARQLKQVDPVMSFPSDMSPYGVFDLAGNAWEWTGDWFDTKYYALIKAQTTVNPTGPTRAAGRIPEVVIKGGSRDWDGAWRSGMRPDARLPYLGFRCVLNLEGGAVVAPVAPAISPNITPPSNSGTIPF